LSSDDLYTVPRQESILALKLQPEDNFLLKIVQLEELLGVRHSVFCIGNAGTGKSQVNVLLIKVKFGSFAICNLCTVEQQNIFNRLKKLFAFQKLKI